MDKHEKLIDLISDFSNAMFVTRDEHGKLHARPMAIARAEENGKIWFVTDRHSGKVTDLMLDNDVALTMQSSKQFVALTGKCQPVDDPKMVDELFDESWKVWFPKGTSDPDLLLLCIEPTQGEYWDNSGLKGIQYLFKAGRAYLAGDRPEVGESINASVSM